MKKPAKEVLPGLKKEYWMEESESLKSSMMLKSKWWKSLSEEESKEETKKLLYKWMVYARSYEEWYAFSEEER